MATSPPVAGDEGLPVTADGHVDVVAGITLLPKDGSGRLTYPLEVDGDVDTSLAVEVAGRDDVDEQFRVSVAHGETPLSTEDADASFFDPGAERSRFAATAGRLASGLPDLEADSEEIAEAIREAFDSVLEEIADGRLAVADEHARELLTETEDVTHSPEAPSTWIVTFTGDRFNRQRMGFDRDQLRIGASEWADTDATPKLPHRRFSRNFAGEEGVDRWRTCRRVWMRMATVGDPPASTLPLTEEALRERGTLPQTPVDLDEFVEMVREADTLSDVKRDIPQLTPNVRLLKHVIRELGLEDELDDVDSRSD